jgi:outer membrane protein, multidrug efflux system
MTRSTDSGAAGWGSLYAALAYLLTLAASALAGCAVGPDYVRPPITSPDRIRDAAADAEAGAVPDAGPDAAQAASLADRAWWEIFPDPTLHALIDEALRNGFDLRLAAARVEEARAEAGIARATFYPAIQGEAGWTRGRRVAGIAPSSSSLGLYDVNLGLTWEIDVWGRIRRLNEAALADYMATEEARRGVLLSLVSEVASSYFELRELDLQLDIARRTARAFDETHALFNRRLEAGAASALETSSAAASLAATNARIPDLERQIVAQENRIALLLGRNPQAIARGLGLTEQPLPPAIPPGLSSDLLERRPDLREAEQRLVAANAEVGVAVADFFPTLSLTGAFGGLSPQVSDLFGGGRTWSVGGGLLTPLFQGRRLKNQHQAALARREEAQVEYEQSVTSAFGEVSTALVAYQKLAEAEKEQSAAVDAYRQAVALSNSRYVGGLSDYLEVLQAQQQLFPAENVLAETRFQRLATLVLLYKALGGGWNLSDPQWPGPETAGVPPGQTAG